MSDMDILIIGGAVGGLAAAERLHKSANVTIFERQSYTDKRVDCGEAINDTTLIPLKKTAENGFVNNVDGFELRIKSDDSPEAETITTSRLSCEPGYICERDTVEMSWANRLRDRGVEIRTEESIKTSELGSICTEYDYVIDASGQPSVSSQAFQFTEEYTGDMVALNTTVGGDFSAYESTPRIFFEGYVGYSWSFPKSASRANVGIGWAGDQRPSNYFQAFVDACERNNLPQPDQEETNIYTIPRGPSLDPQRAYLPKRNLLLVGDAAGIANRYQGEGICQAIRSSYLAADLLLDGRADEYPEQLYSLMKNEYRLAHLMRGAWAEHEDSELLAAVADQLSGLTIDEITRSPSRVLSRVVQNPTAAAKLAADTGMMSRAVQAYLDRWEFNANNSSV